MTPAECGEEPGDLFSKEKGMNPEVPTSKNRAVRQRG